jgi:hypothetical protein
LRFPEDGRFAFSRERARLEQLDRDKGELLNS